MHKAELDDLQRKLKEESHQQLKEIEEENLLVVEGLTQEYEDRLTQLK